MSWIKELESPALGAELFTIHEVFLLLKGSLKSFLPKDNLNLHSFFSLRLKADKEKCKKSLLVIL